MRHCAGFIWQVIGKGWNSLAFTVLVLLGLPHLAWAENSACPEFPPVLSLQLAGIYTDARQSVPDPAAEKKNSDLTAGVDQFLRSIEQALDRPNIGRGDLAAACAYKNFMKWATAGALTVEPKPYNRDGTVKRGEYLIGLNIVALKFRAAGFPLDQNVVGWLRTLNHENLTFYEKASNRGNLRVWAAAAAALVAIIQRDPEAITFQDHVWHEAMAAIHDDGTIDSELARGQRALIYHMFSLSATLVLHSAREALGYRDAPADTARLKLLADMIGRALCDSKPLASRAQAGQEIPGDWAFRELIGFGAGVLGETWSRCGRPAAATSDPTTGGDTRYSAIILTQMAKAAGSRSTAQ